jgi:galactokinase
MDIEGLKQEFRKLYGSHPQVFRAPGRVNLIGEHTDYNEGFVMPAAIDFSTWAAVTSRSDSTFNLRSHSFSEPVSFNLSDGQQPRHNWSDYAVGVIQQIKHSGQRLGGADILIHGEVPIGAGLSSSAAIEVVVGLALLTSSGRSVDRTQLALLCQRAENEFVGMRCGIMDQFVSCHGKSDHALMLDCRTLAFELLPLPATTRMVICNSMVKHQLAAGEYNQRRAACEEGVRILRRGRPTIQSLRDVSVEELESSRDQLPDVIYRRCRHVVTENARVQRAAIMLREGNLRGFGELMAQSHTSLRDDYEVSCRELDTLVEIARRQPGLHGARMTGGGFGGCTINLVSAEHAADFRQNVANAYERAAGLVPEIYISTAADGASQVE